MADKTRNGNQWTEAAFHSFIKSGLRAASRRWPPKYACLNAACVGQQINRDTGRIAKHYKCKSCSIDYPAKLVQVDHINPIVSTGGFTTWDELINNLFCEIDGLQVLCLECHKRKSKLENTIRKMNSG